MCLRGRQPGARPSLCAVPLPLPKLEPGFPLHASRRLSEEGSSPSSLCPEHRPVLSSPWTVAGGWLGSEHDPPSGTWVNSETQCVFSPLVPAATLQSRSHGLSFVDGLVYISL